MEVDTAALQTQQQQQQQDPQAEEDKVTAAPSPPAAAAGDDSSTSSATRSSRPPGAQDLPEDAVAAVAALESLADDEMQLLRSQPGSPEGSWDDSPVASAESASGSADTAAAGLDAGDDTIGLHTASGSSETPSPAPSADTNTYQQQQQQQPRGPPAAGVGDDDDDDTQADVLASGTSAKQGVDLNRAAPPDPALLAPEAAGDDAGGDEDTLTPRGVTSSGLASRAAAAGVTSSSDEDVLDPEVVALVNALWDSTPTPCDPEVDFQLTGEEGLAAWNTSLDDANEELRAAAAARLSSMDGGDPSRLLNNTPNSSSGDSKNSAGGPDLGAQPGLAGDVSPMPADVEVAEAAPGVELRHTGDTPGVTGDTTTGDTAVPEQDGFTAAAAAAVEARLSRQQQEADGEQPQGGTAAPAARGSVGDRTGDTADRVPDGGDPAIASQASSAAAAGTLQAPDAAQDALLTLAVLAAAMGRLNQPGSPSAAPSGDTPAAPAAAAGDTSSDPGDTIPTPHVSILSASSLDGGAEMAAGAAAAAAAGVPSSFVVASADPEELWGSRDEVVLPPGFYQGVVGGSVDGWAADRYPNITGAATAAAAAATGGGAAGGGGDVGEEAAVVYDTIDMTSMVYTLDDGDAAGSSTPDVTSGAGGEEAAEGGAEQQGSGLAPADGSKPEQSGATPAAAATNARKLVAVEGPDLITLDLDARLGESVVAGAVTDVSPDTLEPLDPIITDEVTLPGLVPGCSGLDAESAAAAGNDTTTSGGSSSSGGVGGDSSLAGEAPSDAEGATGDDMEEVLRAAMRRRAAWGMGEAEAAARVEQPELVLVSAEEEGGEGSPPGDEAASDGGEGVQRAGDQGLQGEAAAEEDASSP